MISLSTTASTPRTPFTAPVFGLTCCERRAHGMKVACCEPLQDVSLGKKLKGQWLMIREWWQQFVSNLWNDLKAMLGLGKKEAPMQLARTPGDTCPLPQKS